MSKIAIGRGESGVYVLTTAPVLVCFDIPNLATIKHTSMVADERTTATIEAIIASDSPQASTRKLIIMPPSSCSRLWQ